MYKFIEKNVKGQTNSIIIMFFVVIFLGAFMFLFMLGKSVDTSSHNEYMQLYGNSVLVVLLDTDTGLEDHHCNNCCEKISDIAFYGLRRGNLCKCSDSDGNVDTCLNWLEKKIDTVYFSDALDSSLNKEGLDFYLEFSVGSSKEVFGDENIKTAKKQKWSSESSLYKAGSLKLDTVFILSNTESSA